MLDKENLKFVKNILSVTNNNVNLEHVGNILTSLRDEDYTSFFDIILSCSDSVILGSSFKKTYLDILHAVQDDNHYNLFKNVVKIKKIDSSISELQKVLPVLKSIADNNQSEFYNSILPITNKKLDINLLYNVLKVIKHIPDAEQTIFDSFSDNQIVSKTALLKQIDQLDILNKDSNVVIWGSWYGSILIPVLTNKVKKIVCIDLDETPLQIAKNKLFNEYTNIEYICDNIFKTYRDTYLNSNLIINTSCEHMLPMKEWKWFQKGALATDSQYKHKFSSPKLSDNCYFAFQSNNMFSIEGHVNCVNSLQEFKDQMPERAEVLFEEEVTDTRGTRYMLVGKFNAL